MRVLYIHCAGPFGGSSRSLYEMLCGAQLDGFELAFLTQRGTVVPYFEKFGEVIAVRGLSQFDHGKYSFYRGLRWLILLREIFYLPYSLIGVLRAKIRLKRVDVIHLNDFVGLIPLFFASILFDAKVVIHVRSLVNHDASLYRTRFINKVLGKKTVSVICIDETVRRTIDKNINAKIIHNGLNFSAKPVTTGASSSTALKVGFVGNLLRQKGILDLAEAAAHLKAMGKPCEFFIYGDAIKKSSGLVSVLLQAAGLRQDVKQELIALIKKSSLESNFHFMGFSNDLRKVYESIDVVCFPSHLDAPGRPVLEAACFSKPAIVAVTNPTPDTLIHGVTGLAFESRSVNGLVDAILTLHQDRGLLERMGRAAKSLANEKYDQGVNSMRVLALYESLILKEDLK